MFLSRIERMAVVGLLAAIILFTMYAIWNRPQFLSPKEQAESGLIAELDTLYVPAGVVAVEQYETAYQGIDEHGQVCGVSYVRIVYGSERTVRDLRADYDAALKLAGWISDGTYSYQHAPGRGLTFDYVIGGNRQLTFPTEFALLVSSRQPAFGVCYQPR